jgi:hypothetical protein
MRRISLAPLFLITALGACGSAQPPAPPPIRPALAAILRETKFIPHDDYTGADTPEDQKPLRTAVDDAIRDINALPDPLDAGEVRSRLGRLLSETDEYATEDRDEVGRYAVRIWRAAGFKEDSGLFPVRTTAHSRGLNCVSATRWKAVWRIPLQNPAQAAVTAIWPTALAR